MNFEVFYSVPVVQELDMDQIYRDKYRANEQMQNELARIAQENQQIRDMLKGMDTDRRDSFYSTQTWESDSARVGIYTKAERLERIRRYKDKQNKYREKVRLSRKFTGRSKVAQNKLRIKGRFVKASELPKE